MSADVTRIELAKALKAIKAVATPEQFEATIYIYHKWKEFGGR